MQLTAIELTGFKSFGKKTLLPLSAPVTAIVGPNGSGKSNVAEAFRFVLGEQSMKSMRGKSGSDLIFKGSAKLGQLSRASVSLTFDNTKKLAHRLEDNAFASFDEIVISREIYADGTNEYLINGTKVRLKDITELLTQCNIGSSSHHIISQGEADRILYSGDRERKEMIEDALGLKIHQWRIKESEKKLLKTNENIREAEISRREIAPHLNFLKKQVEKINKATELRSELTGLYHTYLAREEQEIKRDAHELSSAHSSKELEHELAHTAQQVEELRTTLAQEKKKTVDYSRVVNLENKLQSLRTEKDTQTRSLGRLEAEISFTESTLSRQQQKIHSLTHKQTTGVVALERSSLLSFTKDMEDTITQAIWRTEKHEYSELSKILLTSKARIQAWVKELETKEAPNQTYGEDFAETITELQSRVDTFIASKVEIERVISSLTQQEKALQEEIDSARKDVTSSKEESLEQEKKLFELQAHQTELYSRIDLVRLKEIRLHERKERFENELKEGAVLVGAILLQYKNASLVDSGIPQDELRKKIERIKIRLEDVGIANVDEVGKEFDQVKGRDEFLAREIEDLEKSKSSLEVLIVDLKEKLATEFEQGVAKININFGQFFKQMFNGGEAKLSVSKKEKRTRKVDQDEDMVSDMEEEPQLEEGIEVAVSLPQKKVKDLGMLSGGERALTSIALLFAISQVNPPPFLILDETDAALDEANARKYGSMLRLLSEKTKLIVITHNRETMSQGNVLYGVTVGSDGASRVLSIQLEDAAVFAK